MSYILNSYNFLIFFHYFKYISTFIFKAKKHRPNPVKYTSWEAQMRKSEL